MPAFNPTKNLQGKVDENCNSTQPTFCYMKVLIRIHPCEMGTGDRSQLLCVSDMNIHLEMSSLLRSLLPTWFRDTQPVRYVHHGILPSGAEMADPSYGCKKKLHIALCWEESWLNKRECWNQLAMSDSCAVTEDKIQVSSCLTTMIKRDRHT